MTDTQPPSDPTIQLAGERSSPSTCCSPSSASLLNGTRSQEDYADLIDRETARWLKQTLDL